MIGETGNTGTYDKGEVILCERMEILFTTLAYVPARRIKRRRFMAERERNENSDQTDSDQTDSDQTDSDQIDEGRARGVVNPDQKKEPPSKDD